MTIMQTASTSRAHAYNRVFKPPTQAAISCADMTLGAAEAEVRERESKTPLPSLPQLLTEISTAFGQSAGAAGKQAAAVDSKQAKQAAEQLYTLGTVLNRTNG